MLNVFGQCVEQLLVRTVEPIQVEEGQVPVGGATKRAAASCAQAASPEFGYGALPALQRERRIGPSVAVDAQGGQVEILTPEVPPERMTQVAEVPERLHAQPSG